MNFLKWQGSGNNTRIVSLLIQRAELSPERSRAPYQSGLEAAAAQSRANLGEELFAVAYNEFCAPTLEESV
jgi:hypothetical protein